MRNKFSQKMNSPKGKKNLRIAIDGPVAAGKGTVAAEIAERLDIVYVDTGAMYRAVALLGLKNGIDLKSEAELIKMLRESKITFKKVEHDHGTYDIFLNGKNISKEIRTQKVSEGSSIVATLPKIRKFLVKKQKQIAVNQSVIMEGRDIGTRVLPDADLKIFLTAKQVERARRRKKQLEEKGIEKPYEEVLAETKIRDRRDTERQADPLIKSRGAIKLDTTQLTVEETVEKVIELADNIDPKR